MKGAAALFARARGLLAGVSDSRYGIDLEGVLDNIERTLAAISSGSVNGSAADQLSRKFSLLGS